MMLDAQVGLTLGSLDLDVNIAAGCDETVAVLGPNGAGKTTLLRALAGLLALDHGRIVLDGTALDDPAASVFVPPERRSVGVTFQDYLLFAHLSARDNVAFGLQARGTGRRAARAAADEWLRRVGLDGVGNAKPRALSGGQAQRVALARALAISPKLLLLDEPLAALDAGARGAVRRDLRRHLDGFNGARVFVTHDLVDAAALADRLIVIEHGHVVQTGSLASIAARPRSPYVAALVGVNLLRGVLHENTLELDTGATIALAERGAGPSLAVIHPHSVALYREAPIGSPRNVWRGRVDGIEALGERVRVRVTGAVPLVAEVTAGAVRELQLDEGASVWTTIKATDITVYPA